LKKRLIALVFAVVFLLSTTSQVFAIDDYFLELTKQDMEVSTPLLEGDEIDYLYIEVYDSHYEVFYELRDQDGNYLVGGMLHPFENPVLEIEHGNEPPWWPTFPSSVTGISLTLICNGPWGDCEGTATIETF